MRRQKLLATFLFCAPLVFASCGGGQADANRAASVTPAPSPSRPSPAAQPQVVTATVEEARLDAGGSGEATVRIDIAEGYHVNANPASDKFFVATEVRAEPLEGVTTGKPVYPAGLTKKFGFSEKPLSVYEGSTVIRLPLRADKDAARGRHTLRAKIRVQPCNDEACLQPRDIDAPIPVTIN